MAASGSRLGLAASVGRVQIPTGVLLILLLLLCATVTSCGSSATRVPKVAIDVTSTDDADTDATCTGFPSLSSELADDKAWSWTPASTAADKRTKVLFVTMEVIGPSTNGGIGTALTTLALSLAERGMRVAVLFTMGGLPGYEDIYQQWVRYYRSLGIELIGLKQRDASRHPKPLIESLEVALFLRGRKFDIVHCHDYNGACYISMLSKSQGEQAFAATNFAVGMHGPIAWAKKINQENVSDIADLQVDFMERKCVELADFVISPSQYLLDWMRREGWPRNPRTYVQPNVLPKADRQRQVVRAPERVTGIKELVFFGRLETRKGIVLFIQAINKLLSEHGERLQGGMQRIQRVTFLGRTGLVFGTLGTLYVQKLARQWKSVQWSIIDTYGPDEAKAYLSEPNSSRLAVIPSRIENSPYTVVECAERRIPFIASRVGGIVDLIHADDHDEVLFHPVVDALVAKIADVLVHGIRPALPSVDADENERQWIAWHRKVVRDLRSSPKPPSPPVASAESRSFVSVILAVHASTSAAQLEKSINSLRNQTYPHASFEVIVVDASSRSFSSASSDMASLLEGFREDFTARKWRFLRSNDSDTGAEAQGFGSIPAARNAGAATTIAKGEHLFFMNDNHIADEAAIATYVTAMNASGADVLTSFVDILHADGVTFVPGNAEKGYPSHLYLGGSVDTGAFTNCFGASSSFMRRHVFDAIGGYSVDDGAGLQDWEFYADASIRGFKVDVVPHVLYQYLLVVSDTVDTPQNGVYAPEFVRSSRLRALRPYLDELGAAHRGRLLNATLSVGTEFTTLFPHLHNEDDTPVIRLFR